jgi:hypothetical protein
MQRAKESMQEELQSSESRLVEQMSHARLVIFIPNRF